MWKYYGSKQKKRAAVKKEEIKEEVMKMAKFGKFHWQNQRLV